jgi:uncharacterized protein YecE (DUF72 family)
MCDIRVGTSSWADRRLIASGWYPREVNTPAGRLAYYADRFDLVEVDTTFHAIPAVETTTAWVERTTPWFTFDVKAFSLFTGHPTPVSSLPADLRPAAGRDRVRRTDLSQSTWTELWARFHKAIEPIAAAGKLGVVRLQFPSWFARGDAARRRILATAQECAQASGASAGNPVRVAVELPHGSWFEGDHVLETLLFLQRHGISFCCVDGPPEPILVRTADPAVVRLEARAYSELDLRRWARLLRTLADETDELHVLMASRTLPDAARLADLVSRAPRVRARASGPAPAR